jgi:hypothetical protein
MTLALTFAGIGILCWGISELIKAIVIYDQSQRDYGMDVDPE